MQADACFHAAHSQHDVRPQRARVRNLTRQFAFFDTAVAATQIAVGNNCSETEYPSSE